MIHQSLQQNLNQISQICQQLSQNEQGNVSRLQQMLQAEQTASQQLQHCAQLCNQVAQQINQLTAGTQFSNVGQYSTVGQYAGVGAGGFGSYGNWSNRPINTSNAFTGQTMAGQPGQFGGQMGQFGGQATGTQVFNTNKDLGR